MCTIFTIPAPARAAAPLPVVVGLPVARPLQHLLHIQPGGLPPEELAGGQTLSGGLTQEVLRAGGGGEFGAVGEAKLLCQAPRDGGSAGTRPRGCQTASHVMLCSLPQATTPYSSSLRGNAAAAGVGGGCVLTVGLRHPVGVPLQRCCASRRRLLDDVCSPLLAEPRGEHVLPTDCDIEAIQRPIDHSLLDVCV
eukprot:1182911-Prorocentrum_minimum.AAC.6